MSYDEEFNIYDPNNPPKFPSQRELKGVEFENYGKGKSPDEFDLQRALGALTEGEVLGLLSGTIPKPMDHDSIDAAIEENDTNDFFKAPSVASYTNR